MKVFAFSLPVTCSHAHADPRHSLVSHYDNMSFTQQLISVCTCTSIYSEKRIDWQLTRTQSSALPVDAITATSTQITPSIDVIFSIFSIVL